MGLGRTAAQYWCALLASSLVEPLSMRRYRSHGRMAAIPSLKTDHAAGIARAAMVKRLNRVYVNTTTLSVCDIEVMRHRLP